MKSFRKILGIVILLCVLVLAGGYAIPERCAMPCGNVNSYNKGSFWTHPWTRGVNGSPHYGVGIFGKEGSPVVS